MNGKSDFVIKDLAISIRPESGGGAGATWMPSDDGEPLPWWISPIAAVLDKGVILDAISRTITESLDDDRQFETILRAFDGDPDGNPAIRHAIKEIGGAVVAAAAYRSIGGKVGYPNPECGGTSLETIPPHLTPVVHKGLEVHRLTELPRLRRQLEIAVETLDQVAAGLEPRGEEAEMVARHLEQAREGLAGAATAA